MVTLYIGPITQTKSHREKLYTERTKAFLGDMRYLVSNLLAGLMLYSALVVIGGTAEGS